MKATYLAIDICTLLGPLLMAGERSVRFSAVLRLLVWTIPLVALPFLLWDHVFTELGVWSFNPQFTTGLHLGFLPIEEVLFFFTVPLACLYLYEIVRRHYLRRDSELQTPVRLAELTRLLGYCLLFASLLVLTRKYTCAVCILGGIALLHASRQKYLFIFSISYVLHLVPFLMINGLLTALPVVLYNPREMLNLRCGSIPVEDFLYSLVLFYGNVFLREYCGPTLNTVTLNRKVSDTTE
jgi:lycopene cyclase domain-containing protein